MMAIAYFKEKRCILYEERECKAYVKEAFVIYISTSVAAHKIIREMWDVDNTCGCSRNVWPHHLYSLIPKSSSH